jgi:hypothetical protein
MAVRLSALRAGRDLFQKNLLILISVRGSVKPRVMVGLEELGKLKKVCDLDGTRNSNLLARSVTPQPSMLPRAHRDYV